MIRTTAAALVAPLIAGPPLADAALAGGHLDSEKTVVVVAQEAGDFTALLAAAEAVGLVETLNGEGPSTVFAPTDEAFAALPEGTVDTLMMEENRDRLTQILTMHVVEGTVTSADLADGATLTSMEGSDLAVGVDGDTMTVDGATITAPDVEAANGVIHVLDAVIRPADT